MKHKSDRLPAGDVHVLLPGVQSYSISVDAALIKNSLYVWHGQSHCEAGSQACCDEISLQYNASPDDDRCKTADGVSCQTKMSTL